MPLFVCKECQCIENTALSGYWWRIFNALDKRALCSGCDKTFVNGWHNKFSKEKFNPETWEYESDSREFVKRKYKDNEVKYGLNIRI